MNQVIRPNPKRVIIQEDPSCIGIDTSVLQLLDFDPYSLLQFFHMITNLTNPQGQLILLTRLHCNWRNFNYYFLSN